MLIDIKVEDGWLWKCTADSCGWQKVAPYCCDGAVEIEVVEPPVAGYACNKATYMADRMLFVAAAAVGHSTTHGDIPPVAVAAWLADYGHFQPKFAQSGSLFDYIASAPNAELQAEIADTDLRDAWICAIKDLFNNDNGWSDTQASRMLGSTGAAGWSNNMSELLEKVYEASSVNYWKAAAALGAQIEADCTMCDPVPEPDPTAFVRKPSSTGWYMGPNLAPFQHKSNNTGDYWELVTYEFVVDRPVYGWSIVYSFLGDNGSNEFTGTGNDEVDLYSGRAGGWVEDWSGKNLFTGPTEAETELETEGIESFAGSKLACNVDYQGKVPGNPFASGASPLQFRTNWRSNTGSKNGLLVAEFRFLYHVSDDT